MSKRTLAKLINRFERQIVPFGSELAARIHGGRISAFWWAGARNFGDLLTPVLLRKYGLRPVYCRNPRHADIASTGSILEMVPEDFAGIVLGSGLLTDRGSPRLPSARILALRGELTKRCLGITEGIALGDPGLLACDLIPYRTLPKRYVLGVIPHYKDLDNPVVRAIAERYRKQVRVINVQRSPRSVIQDIDSCEHIVSSSLHGVIVADSLNIPNRWTLLSNQVMGDGFKFRDYYSALGLERTPVEFSESDPLSRILDSVALPPLSIEVRKDALRSLFRTVADQFLGTSKGASQTQRG